MGFAKDLLNPIRWIYFCLPANGRQSIIPASFAAFPKQDLDILPFLPNNSISGKRLSAYSIAGTNAYYF
jgi:hypothetical protein